MLRLISRLAATAVAIPAAIQEGHTLWTYTHTHSIQRNGRGPWAKQTSLWPSVLLFSIALLTAILGIAITISYLFSIKAANRVSSVQDKLSIGNEVGHVIVWIGVAIAYRVGKNGKDLWGWACSPLAEKIQGGFEGVVDFEKVCSRGVSLSWSLTQQGLFEHWLTGLESSVGIISCRSGGQYLQRGGALYGVSTDEGKEGA